MNYSIKSMTKLAASILMIVLLTQKAHSQKNHISISVNSLSTSFDYGKANSTLRPYKKDFKGIQFGIACESGISPMFSIVKGLYFSAKGGILNENNPYTVNKSTLKLYTLDVPLLARIHFNNFYVNAGPYVAYTLGGNMKSDGAESLPVESGKISFGNSAYDFNRWDFGALAGVGYNFNMKKSILTLDVRYGYGFVNISNNIQRYNRSLSISVLLSKPPRNSRKNG